MTPRTNAGGLAQLKRSSYGPSRWAWGAGACKVCIGELGGCLLMLTQVYTACPLQRANGENFEDFTKQPVGTAVHA